jgi:hypothetical protein
MRPLQKSAVILLRSLNPAAYEEKFLNEWKIDFLHFTPVLLQAVYS